MRRAGFLTAAALAALLGASSHAAPCSDAETQQADALYVVAADSAACSQFAAVLPWSVTIWWSCDNKACVDVMRQLALDLPDCEDVAGANAKSDLARMVGDCGSGTTTSTLGSSSSSSSSSSESDVTPVPIVATSAAASRASDSESDSRSESGSTASASSSSAASGSHLRSRELASE